MKSLFPLPMSSSSLDATRRKRLRFKIPLRVHHRSLSWRDSRAVIIVVRHVLLEASEPPGAVHGN